MKRGFLLLSGLGIGAGLAYLLDPAQGRRRRSRLRANVWRARHRAADFLDTHANTMWGQTRGVLDNAQMLFPTSYRMRAGRFMRRGRPVPADTGLLLLGCLGLGASLLLLLGARKVSQAVTSRPKSLTQIRDWARGFMTETGNRFGRRTVSDTTLVAQAQSRLNRLVSRPSAIEITVNQGQLTLSGPVLDREYEDLLASVASIRGVKEVVNRLDVQERTTTIMGVEDHPAQ
jgi:BON domain